jgi:alkylation response protein AidB-like acyl-CoA dehydrogenase
VFCAVNLAFSEEQRELRRIVRQFLEAKSPEAAVRAQMGTVQGYDSEVWAQLADQLGLQALAIPEEFGGQGYGFVELVVVLEEMGRALLCAPFFSTSVLATTAVLASGDPDECAATLPGIASGATVATLAFTEPHRRTDDGDGDGDGDGGEGDETRALRSTDGTWQISGTKAHVLDGHVADVVLVVARTESGLSLFRVAGDSEGLTRTPLATMDQTRTQAELRFDGVTARLVGAEGGAGPVLDRVLDIAAAALAAEQVGGTARCLEMAVEHAKERVQFGRPIGSFQAVKHLCADLLLQVESARSAAYYAAWAVAEESPEVSMVASLAKAYCSDAYVAVATENIQIHGGIGFTWEHPAHLYFKRATSSAVLFGDPTHHRDRIAHTIGI